MTSTPVPPGPSKSGLRGAGLIAAVSVIVLIFVYLAAQHILNAGAVSRHEPKKVDLKALGNFNFDQVDGVVADIPVKFRELDGQRVAVEGFMWSPTPSNKLTHFQFVYNLVDQHGHGPPQVQERIFASCPEGKKVPYLTDYLKMVGTFHVRVQKEDGIVASVYSLDVEKVERL